MAAVIYSNGSQECERMAQLLKSLGGEFLEYKLNHHFSLKEDLRKSLVKMLNIHKLILDLSTCWWYERNPSVYERGRNVSLENIKLYHVIQNYLTI